MTRLIIPDEATVATFTVSTSDDSFPIAFALFAKADLRITVDGVELTQAEFSFSGTLLDGGGYQGGTVTLNDAVENCEVVIWRDIAPARASQFAPSNSVPVRSIDQAFNRDMAVAQDLRRDVERAILRPIGETTDFTLPSIEDRASLILGFDENGDLSVGAGSGAGLGALVDLSNVTPLTGRTALGFGGNSRQFAWGTYFLPTPDTLTDYQFAIAQKQDTYGSGGSLGAGYFQRISTYTGGATGDNQGPACSAMRGYNQIPSDVTWCNEMGALGVTDNYSWHGQAVGIFGQANSYHGGRTFGLEAEAKEFSESFTATAGQTVFVVPNNFTYGSSIVTKNNTQLTAGVGYTETAKPAADATGTITSISGSGSVVTVAFTGGFTPPVNYHVDIAGVTPNVYNGRFKVLTSSAGNVTLSCKATGTATVLGTLAVKTALAGSITLASGAAAGDTIVVSRGDPEYATIGGEVIVYSAAGLDRSNTISGNRIGLAVSAYRAPNAPNVPTRVGTIMTLVVDPSDANLRANRGFLFQGKYETGIDFTASNVNFNNYLMKFNTAGAGFAPSGNLSIGDQSPLDTAGYAILRLRNNTNGGLIEIGDASVLGRVQASTGAGVIFGSDTNTEVVFTQNATERLRLTASLVSANAPVKLRSYLKSTVPAASVGAGATVYITDLTGGAEPCFSDATNWRRGSDRTVMS